MTQAVPASNTPTRDAAAEASRCVRSGLDEAALMLQCAGVPTPRLDGKLLRPLVAYALVPPEVRGAVDRRFWSGALAVEMAHEASLLHDDILDDGKERRGRKTLAARSGTAAALVLGDHYLTGAYRAAAATGSGDFLEAFIEGVERTVAGEIEQERAAGRFLDEQSYEGIVRGKSGELFGAAACLGGAIFSLGSATERIAVGRALGGLYQRVDDLLDYCPAARTGKPPLQDYHQRKWTWVLGAAGVETWSLDDDALLRRLFSADEGGSSPARRALASLCGHCEELVRQVDLLSPGDTLVAGVLDAWIQAAGAGVSAQEEALGVKPAPTSGTWRPSPEAEVVSLARALGGPEAWPDYFGHHAKTFRFAARLFPQEASALITGVYAYCRFTDDLVDEPADGARPDVLEARLEAWSHLSRTAFEGRGTGAPLLDEVMGEAGRRGVSWRYPDALLAGVAMDLSQAAYPDWAALEEYTFGVAGAVGGWITQLFGIHDEALLVQAHALGHAMQLTNIARDVGDDLAMGRVYLPAQLLDAHGLAVDDLARLAANPAPLPPAYRDLVEELLLRSEAYYDEAWPGIRALPGWYRRPVAVAAEAYRGIHREIRGSGYDNLRRRSATSLSSKLLLAASGLARSRG